MSDAGDAYDFYPCLVDDAPASIYVNMRYEAAPPAAPTRYTVAVAMRDAGEYGIGSAAEAETLNVFEEMLIARMPVTYVGRVRTRGIWESAFYGADGELARLTEAARTADLGGRRVEVRGVADPGWVYYRELLLPDAERRQWMDDRRLVQILREQGDALVTPRRVDHWASFASAQARDAYLIAAAAAGFETAEPSQSPSEARPYAAHVFRTDPIELDHIHDVVMTLVGAAAASGGEYDRWETSIER